MLSANHSAVEVEAVSSGSPPGDFCVVEGFLSEVGLGGAGQDMGLVEPVESSLLGLSKDEGGQLGYGLGGRQVCVNLPNSRYHLGLLGLVVEDGDLLALFVAELFSEERVAGYNGDYLGVLFGNDRVDGRTSNQHRRVGNLLVPLQSVLSFLRHRLEFHQHISSRNPQVPNQAVPVVLCVETLLRPHVPHLNSRKRPQSLRVPDRHQKSMKSVAPACNYELGEQGGVGAVNPEVADPPLGRRDCGTVDEEAVGFRLKGRSGLQPLNVRPMSQLRLCVAAQNLPFEGRLVEGPALLLVAEVVESRQEHLRVEREGSLVVEEVSLGNLRRAVEGKEVVVLVEPKDLFSHVAHHIFPGLVEEGGIEAENGVVVDDLLLSEVVFEPLLAPVDEVGEFQPAKGGFLALVFQHACNKMT